MELQNRNYFLLNAQLRRSQDDLRQAKRRLEALEKEKKVVTEQIDEVNLHNDSTATQLIAKVKEKEEIMVEENILRLELKKLRSFLNVRADQVYSLESRQVELQIALEERTHEIEIHKDIVRAQIKAADEERRSAVQELRDRMNKVDKMKRRYEILMAQFASPDDEDGHEKTQAYYIIKASQVIFYLILVNNSRRKGHLTQVFPVLGTRSLTAPRRRSGCKNSKS
ncbi:hypothetical protein BKA69DRAFT_313558 [Paraphysoderma sedebokerense]|nr:hypothetical protein BKA69DRAFT_313558 [Paraphysoderma sedebokerense]